MVLRYCKGCEHWNADFTYCLKYYMFKHEWNLCEWDNQQQE